MSVWNLSSVMRSSSGKQNRFPRCDRRPWCAAVQPGRGYSDSASDNLAALASCQHTSWQTIDRGCS